MKSKIGRGIKEKRFDIPPPEPLPHTDISLPYVFLGDEAFPLLDNLMKPYRRCDSAIDKTKAIFNYRLSRARRYVENVFGILTAEFRIFSTEINLDVKTAENMVSSACILHNLIIDEKDTHSSDIPSSSNHSPFEEHEHEHEHEHETNHIIRNAYKDYFNDIGALHFQNRMIGLE